MSKANVSIYHPNDAGNGSGMSAEMHYQIDGKPGFIRFKLFNQDGVSYHFDDAVVFDAEIVAVSQMLRVLRGESGDLNGGNPISSGDSMFAMRRLPKDGGIALAAYCKTNEDNQKSCIVLNAEEALCLRLSLEGAMFFLAFVKGINP